MQKLREKADCEENDENTLKLAASEIPRLLGVLDNNGNELCGELNGRVDYLEEEADADVLYMAQIAESSLASPEDGCSLGSCNFLDNTGGGAQWWDF